VANNLEAMIKHNNTFAFDTHTIFHIRDEEIFKLLGVKELFIQNYQLLEKKFCT
jgi:hypothetical protein